MLKLSDAKVRATTLSLFMFMRLNPEHSNVAAAAYRTVCDLFPELPPEKQRKGAEELTGLLSPWPGLLAAERALLTSLGGQYG